MSELYFVAVHKKASFPQIQRVCANNGAPLAHVSTLDVPDLRVGTLDSLMAQSEILERTDAQCESLTLKMGRLLHDLLVPEHGEKLEESLSANGSPIEQFIDAFRWDVAKYPTKLSIAQLEEIIQKSVAGVDKGFKARTAQYSAAKNAVAMYDRKYKGTLANKSLTGLVKKEHFVDSEYLKTLFVVVPKSSKRDWKDSYENLVPFIVPKSSQLILEEDEFCLFNVVCFQRVAEEFKIKAREKKFIVREHVYKDGEYEAGLDERAGLEEAELKQWGLLVRWTKINFAEAFSATVHVKVLRLFVESILRFSLPPDFCTAVIRPLNKKNDKKIRELLDQCFAEKTDAVAISDADKMSLRNVTGMSSLLNGEFRSYIVIEGENLTRNKVMNS